MRKRIFLKYLLPILFLIGLAPAAQAFGDHERLGPWRRLAVLAETQGIQEGQRVSVTLPFSWRLKASPSAWPRQVMR